MVVRSGGSVLWICGGMRDGDVGLKRRKKHEDEEEEEREEQQEKKQEKDGGRKERLVFSGREWLQGWIDLRVVIYLRWMPLSVAEGNGISLLDAPIRGGDLAFQVQRVSIVFVWRKRILEPGLASDRHPACDDCRNWPWCFSELRDCHYLDVPATVAGAAQVLYAKHVSIGLPKAGSTFASRVTKTIRCRS